MRHRRDDEDGQTARLVAGACSLIALAVLVLLGCMWTWMDDGSMATHVLLGASIGGVLGAGSVLLWVAVRG